MKASWDAIKYILDPGKKTKAKGSEGIAPSVRNLNRFQGIVMSNSWHNLKQLIKETNKQNKFLVFS